MKLTLVLVLFTLSLVRCQESKFYDEVKNSRDFTGKVVLVTGSSVGIGKTTTKLFSALGAQVVVTGRKLSDVQATSKEAQDVSPKKLKPLQVVADFTNSTQVAELIDTTLAHYGKLDVLVLNAGLFVETDFINNASNVIHDTDLSFQIGVRAHLQIILKAVNALSKAKGSIVAISSDWVQSPQESFLPFEITKTSLEMITLVLAQELGPKGIRVNAIRPGLINSFNATQHVSERVARATPLGRMGQNEDIAKGVVVLASSDAQYITGAILNIDGGMSLGMGGSTFKNYFGEYVTGAQ